MGLSGKLVSQMSIKSGGNVFYELLSDKVYKLSEICSETIERIDLERGQWGAVGSIICWHFHVDGEKVLSKEIIEDVDEKNKSITFTSIEGDMLKEYKSFKSTLNVATNDDEDGNDLITWTFEYERKNEDVPDPHWVMDSCLDCTKAIFERYHMLVPK